MTGDLASTGGSINDLGQVIATSDDTGEDWGHDTRSYLWTPSGQTDLTPHIGMSNAIEINGNGIIVGRTENSGSSCNPFVWSESQGYNLLPKLNENDAHFNVALSINEPNLISGYSTSPVDGYRHAVVWEDFSSIIDLGTLDGCEVSMPQGLNNMGQVVGWSRNLNNPRWEKGFIWSKDGGMVELPSLADGNTYAYGINNFGIVVGRSDPFPLGDDEIAHAVIWQNESVTDLNELIADSSFEYVLTSAVDISDNGQIIAFSQSSFLPARCTEPIVGDLDDDCQVDLVDLAMMAENWPPYNIVDLVMMAENWMTCNLDPHRACWK